MPQRAGEMSSISLPSPAELNERFAAVLARCSFGSAPAVPHADSAMACAVSGGADSTALAVLAVAAGLRPTLHHVDHGLRQGSDREAAVVERLALGLGVGFVTHTKRVEPGPNLEARCRVARFSVLPDNVATGHTADDRAETILMNLMRGAGSAGLSAMEPSARHPILGLRRSETHQLCADLGLDVVHDPSNNDPAFTRNRVRHELLPLLEDIADRDVVAVLNRQAELMGAELALLASQAAELDPTDAKSLAAAPEPVARQALRDWLLTSLSLEHPPDAATVQRALDVAKGGAVATDLGGGWRLARSQQRLAIVPPAAASR